MDHYRLPRNQPPTTSQIGHPFRSRPRHQLEGTSDAETSSSQEDDEEDNAVVETDPSGRFSRYRKALGKGAYKAVYKAFDEEEGKEVAWNQLRVDHLAKRDAQRVLSEIAILQSLRNDYIINLLHHWEAKGRDGRERVYFITELMTSGTLKTFLKKSKAAIKPKVLRSYCKQILLGLEYLHSRSPPIIHRDLKCDNIFVNGFNGQVKLGDLGLAIVKSRDHVSSVLGTPEFMAPELYDENYDEKVDIYAFGMVVMEIVTKEYPYSECTNQAQIYKRVTSQVKPLAIQKVQDRETREFIELCTRFNPAERPSARELLQSSFLNAPIPQSTDALADADVRQLSATDSSLGSSKEEGSNRNQHGAASPKRALGIAHSQTDFDSVGPSSSIPPNSLPQIHFGAEPERLKALPSVPVATSFPAGSAPSVIFEMVDRVSESVVTLRMVYSVPGREKAQEIRFPFNLPEDTATDVISEMVKENLIDAADEQLARRKLEEKVKGFLLAKITPAIRGVGTESQYTPVSANSSRAPSPIHMAKPTSLDLNYKHDSYSMTVPRLRQSVSDLKQSAMFNSLPRTATANGNSFDVYPQSNARSHPLVPTISQSSSLEISSPDQNGFSYPPSPTFANSSRPATSDSPSPPLVFSTSHAKHNNDSSASAASGPTAMDFSAPTQSNFGRRDASQGSLKPSGPTDSDRLERSYSSASVASIASLASTISQGSTVATHSSNLNNPTPQPTPPQPTPGTVPASTQNLQNATFHQQFLDLQERSLKDLGSRPVVGLPLGAAGMGPVNRLKTESPNHIWLKPNQGSKPSGSLSASLLLGQGAVFFDSPAASGATWPQVSSPAAFSHAVNVVRPESPPSGNGSQTKLTLQIPSNNVAGTKPLTAPSIEATTLSPFPQPPRPNSVGPNPAQLNNAESAAAIRQQSSSTGSVRRGVDELLG